MRKMVVAAIGIPIAAALGLGFYEISKQSQPNSSLEGQSTQSTLPAPVSPQYSGVPRNASGVTSEPQSDLPSPSVTGVNPNQPVGVQNGRVGLMPTQVPSGATINSSGSRTALVGPTTLTPAAQPVPLYSEQAVSAPPPVVTERTTVEKSTVTDVPAERKVYVTRKVYVSKTHKKSGKVHIARATKHGAMFALKLPGRLAL